MAQAEESQRRRRAALGTLIFAVLVPGTVAGYVPYLLSGWRLAPGVAPRLFGAALIVAALPVFIAFLVRFAREGIGTPAPIAPTERLVVGGPFRRVRNPGYLSVVALVAGQGILFASPATLLYAAHLALGFHAFVVLYEEPTLRRRFGSEYEDYCRRVPRWWPKLRAPPPALALLLALACASTRVETQWRDPEIRPEDLAFRSVIALAQMEDETVRRAAEDELVRVLVTRPAAHARGLHAVASYTLIPTRELADVEKVRAKVEAGGFDGAVVLRLVSSEDRVSYVPGRYETMWGRYGRIYEPGYTTVDRIVRIETSLYSTAKGKRLWSGVSRTLNPGDVRELVDDVARAVGDELAKQGLAP